ncbi:hypothetical protein [Actinomadura luteofluorescens]
MVEHIFAADSDAPLGPTRPKNWAESSSWRPRGLLVVTAVWATGGGGLGVARPGRAPASLAEHDGLLTAAEMVMIAG